MPENGKKLNVNLVVGGVIVLGGLYLANKLFGNGNGNGDRGDDNVDPDIVTPPGGDPETGLPDPKDVPPKWDAKEIAENIYQSFQGVANTPTEVKARNVALLVWQRLPDWAFVDVWNKYSKFYGGGATLLQDMLGEWFIAQRTKDLLRVRIEELIPVGSQLSGCHINGGGSQFPTRSVPCCNGSLDRIADDLRTIVYNF